MAADLPAGKRAELKAMALDLASTLLLQMGLDPTHSIHALGKTASLLGHSVQVGQFTFWPDMASPLTNGDTASHAACYAA
jgi:hypothetical protein